MGQTLELPGTEAPKIKAIENCAEKYVDIRDTRMEWTKKEVTAKSNLIEVVLANQDKLAKNDKGDRFYRYGDDMLVVLNPGKPGVKVKHVSIEEDDDEYSDE